MLDNFYNVLLKSRDKISRSFKLISNQKLSTKQLEDLEEKLIETDMGYDTVQDILSLFQNSYEDKLSHDIRSYLVKSLSVDFNFKNKNNVKTLIKKVITFSKLQIY